MNQKIYNLALRVYSCVRYGEYVSAKYLVIELLDLLETEIRTMEKNNA